MVKHSDKSTKWQGFIFSMVKVNTGKKILIIQTAFIGDVILTTPLIEALSAEFPSVEIDFLTIPKSKNLLESNPNISNLIIFDKRGRDRGLKGMYHMGKVLKDNHYDICITPHRSLRSAYLTRQTRAPIRIGFNKSTWQRVFTHIIKYDSTSHEIDRNFSLLSAIGIKKEKVPPVLYATEEDKKSIELLLQQEGLQNKNLFAVAPGSVWPTKKWPESYFMDFCQGILKEGVKPVLIGGPDDFELCNRISSESIHIINTAGKLSLRETFFLLKQCSGILTNDSAPLHLGMAANINVFAIFGPTVPEFGFAPFGPKSRIFENRDLACRPCAIHGSKKCPVKTFDCMLALEPMQIAQQVMNDLEVITK